MKILKFRIRNLFFIVFVFFILASCFPCYCQSLCDCPILNLDEPYSHELEVTISEIPNCDSNLPPWPGGTYTFSHCRYCSCHYHGYSISSDIYFDGDTNTTYVSIGDYGCIFYGTIGGVSLNGSCNENQNDCDSYFYYGGSVSWSRIGDGEMGDITYSNFPEYISFVTPNCCPMGSAGEDANIVISCPGATSVYVEVTWTPDVNMNDPNRFYDVTQSLPNGVNCGNSVRVNVKAYKGTWDMLATVTCKATFYDDENGSPKDSNTCTITVGPQTDCCTLGPP